MRGGSWQSVAGEKERLVLRGMYGKSSRDRRSVRLLGDYRASGGDNRDMESLPTVSDKVRL